MMPDSAGEMLPTLRNKAPKKQSSSAIFEMSRRLFHPRAGCEKAPGRRALCVAASFLRQQNALAAGCAIFYRCRATP